MNSGSFNLKNVSMHVGNFGVDRPWLWIKDKDPRTTPDIAFYFCQII